MFSGHPDFKRVMSRTRFVDIRRHLVVKADVMDQDGMST